MLNLMLSENVMELLSMAVVTDPQFGDGTACYVKIRIWGEAPILINEAAARRLRDFLNRAIED